jgi:DNA-binding transcriptional MerR regulator
MDSNNKSKTAYKTIGEVTKELGLINQKTGRIQTHTIRYWETQFKQIKPIIRAGKRRYYSTKVFKIIKYIKFLLKEEGLTINGAKKILNMTKTDSLDDLTNMSINRPNLNRTEVIKNKVKNISKIIKELKKFK